MKTLLLVLMLAVSSAAHAQSLIVPQLDRARGVALPDVQVEDDSGLRFSLSLLRAKNRALIVVPFYTRCKASCSPLADHLKTALAAAQAQSGLAEDDYKVLSFSFDDEETNERLSAFRARHHLPPSWLVVRSDRASIERLFEAMDFHVLTLPRGEFQHANLVAIYSRDLRLSSFLANAQFDGPTLTQAVRVAGGAPLPPVFLQNLLLISLAGLVLTGFFLHGFGADCSAKNRLSLSSFYIAKAKRLLLSEQVTTFALARRRNECEDDFRFFSHQLFCP